MIKEKDKRIMVRELLNETKNIYDRNSENTNKIDAKIVQLFTFITALTLLFINIIKFPNTKLAIFLYIITIILFIVSLFLLITAYKPMGYFAIEPNALITKYCKGKYKNEIDLIGAIAGTTAENVKSLKDNIRKKSIIIDICAYLTIVGLILIIILKIMQGV